MRLLINGVPQVCQSLQDQSKCKEILTYCNENSSEALCTIKLIGEATLNTFKPSSLINGSKNIYNFGAKAIYNAQMDGYMFQQKIEAWYTNVVPNKVDDAIVGHSLVFIGKVVDSFIN